MAGHATQQMDASTLWGGKISPFSTSYGKLMMWFFLLSDAFTFSALGMVAARSKCTPQIFIP